MSHIFLSYAREDRDKVQPLVRLLEADGFTVWWDINLRPGERFSDTTRNALDEARCVIVAWSSNSLQSNWVPDEAAVGRDRGVLVPISLDGTEPPLGFRQLQTAALGDWRGDANDQRIQHLLNSVRLIAGLPQRQTSATRQVDAAANSSSKSASPATPHSNKIFLIVASLNEEWQVLLNNDLLQAAQRANLFCTVFVPSEDHVYGEHQALQRTILANANDYSGGLSIISGWRDDRVTELMEFATQLSKPIVFVDRNPPIPSEEMPSNVAYVSVSDADGGRCAAEAVLQLSREHPVKRILVMHGFTKEKRVQAFEETVKKNLKKCSIVVSEDGKFDRWISENVTYNLLTNALKEDEPFDAIYCTSGSMTLGCFDAIIRVEGWRKHPKPLVIGYDGTRVTRRLVDDSDRSRLARIVVQDTKEIARAAVEQLIHMYQGKKGEIVWIDPQLYPRLTASGLDRPRKRPRKSA